MLNSKRRRGIGRRALLAGATMASFPAIRVQAQTGGVALVIGNSRYTWEAPLPNVRRDAPDITKRFQTLGLKTELLQDAGADAMRRAVDNFTAASRGANLAALYFAGHGASWKKNTYLVPVDTDLSTPSVVEKFMPVNAINVAMKGAANRLLVLDNCRNNPAGGWRQVEAEHTAGAYAAVEREFMAANPNTLLLFSTAPGHIALDGPAGQNSPFAASLLRQLESPSVDLQSLPARLRRDLLIATQGRQVVWDRNSYQHSFVLNGSGGATGPANRSGWNQDPSRIIELTNAYPFAAANGLGIPPGLIAYRPPGNSSDGWKVGTFKFMGQTPLGLQPQILVVMSVEEKQTAEVIVASKTRAGPSWGRYTATLSGNRIDFSVTAAGGAVRFQFTWNDANSGSLSQLVFIGGSTPTPLNGPFSRLDG